MGDDDAHNALKPSDLIVGNPPFVGLLGRSELEVAAAWIVRAGQVHGDTWAPVTVRPLALVLDTETEEAWARLRRNHFLVADFEGLVRAGFAAWHGGEGPGRAIALTDAGRAALAVARRDEEVPRG